MGSGSIKIIYKEVTGNVFINVSSQYNNIHADNVTISKNVTARLYGSIKEKVILKKGSILFLHGVIKGKVDNEGGEIYIFDPNE